MRVPTKTDSLKRLRPLGLKTVIDVGVHYHTSSLIKVFDDCEHILIEKDAYWLPSYAETYKEIRHRVIHMEASEVNRVDAIQFDSPALLKIDVDGDELGVLRGSVNAFPNIAAIVVEAVTDKIVHTLNFLSYFKLFDIVDLAYCGNQLYQCDLILVNPCLASGVFSPWDLNSYQPYLYEE